MQGLVPVLCLGVTLEDALVPFALLGIEPGPVLCQASLTPALSLVRVVILNFPAPHHLWEGMQCAGPHLQVS